MNYDLKQPDDFRISHFANEGEPSKKLFDPINALGYIDFDLLQKVSMKLKIISILLLITGIARILASVLIFFKYGISDILLCVYLVIVGIANIIAANNYRVKSEIILDNPVNIVSAAITPFNIFIIFLFCLSFIAIWYMLHTYCYITSHRVQLAYIESRLGKTNT